METAGNRHFPWIRDLLVAESLRDEVDNLSLPHLKLSEAPWSGVSTRGYVAELHREGATKEEVQRRTAIIMQLFSERSEGVEVYFDHIFSRSVSGKPEVDGFNSEPSAFLVEAIRGLKPGMALDAGMGWVCRPTPGTLRGAHWFWARLRRLATQSGEKWGLGFLVRTGSVGGRYRHIVES